MSVFTVHEPPRRAVDDAVDVDRFVFVRDGFSVWAFLLAPLWMLRHRMWLVLTIYLLVSAGLETAMVIAGASDYLVALVAMLIALLVGLEAGTLRRFTLSRSGWRNVGIVSGDDLEDAERRFFDAWIRETSSRSGSPTPGAAASPLPPTPRAPDVIGLFPEPGAQR